MTKHVSLCILAYKRPEMLVKCIQSILQTADYPHSIIVNLDADDSGNAEYLFDLYKAGVISYLIMNGGGNRGVGRSFANCVGVAEGDYIFKIDTDLIFKPNWLSTAVHILEHNEDVGAVSLFNYRHYDPYDKRFEILEERKNCSIVNDFVSSTYMFHRSCLDLGGWDQDDGFHTRLTPLAITKEDMCVNNGFGKNSVYVTMVDEDPRHSFKTPTHAEPLIRRKSV